MPELNYTPDGKVLRAFMLDDSFVRGIRGPVGSGKTVACCIEMFRRACQQAPAPDGIRYTRWIVIRNTQPELKSTTIKTWQDWFPEHAWGRMHMQPPFTHHIRVQDIDMEVIFLALDSPEDVKKLYSLEATGAWINEARFVPKAILDTCTERVGRYPAMRIGGPTWKGVVMDTNAMDPDHWWPILAGDSPVPEDMPEEEALMLQKPPDWRFFNQPGAMLEVKDGQGRTIGWEMNPEAENLRYLPPDYYQKQIQGKTRSHILRNVGNKLVVVKEGKSVYQSFNEDTHVASAPLPIFAELPVHIGIDFGLTPAAAIGQTLRGRWLIQRELVTQNMGAQAFAQELKRLLGREYPQAREFIIHGDPAGDIRAQTDETTPFMILHAAGLQAYPTSTNDFVIRVETVDSVLTRLVDGQPAFLLDPGCRHLKKAMAGGYHYPKLQQSGAGEVRYADRPLKNMSSHIAEALQYLLLGGGEAAGVTRGPNQSRRRPVQAKRSWNLFDRHRRR